MDLPISSKAITVVEFDFSVLSAAFICTIKFGYSNVPELKHVKPYK